ncbi:hypothetical protein BC829DRAFT_361994, partial [Chytridium lagenaria]
IQAHVRRKYGGTRGVDHADLFCRWLGCRHGPKAFTKRNHIISHCRSHVELWSNSCVQCERAFKW